MQVSSIDRERRSVFIEADNRNYNSSEFNEIIIEKYAQQILASHPEARQKVNNILDSEESLVIDKAGEELVK